MPATNAEEVTVPLKNMDIKTAFLMASNRKRKATTSPSVPKHPTKTVRLSTEEKDDAVQVIEVCKDNNVSLVDSKENTDLNGVTSPLDQKRPLPHSADEELKVASETCGTTATSDSEDLNSSVNPLGDETLNSAKEEAQSANTSIDLIIEAVARGEFEHKDEEPNQKDAKQLKKRKRMTPEEAKAKAQQREEKQKDRMLKKQKLEEQKLQEKMDKEKRKQEREKAKQLKDEEKKAKDEEKKEKEKLRLEKKEQEEKEKLQKQKEREESKQLKLEAKQEEKKKKEELRLKREEEQKKVEEEKKEKELKEKQSRERAKAAFVKFFKKEASSPPTAQITEKEGFFKPFQVTEDMTLAPVVPPLAQERFNKSHLDDYLNSVESSQELYLNSLLSGSYKDVRRRKRQPKSTSDADVMIVDDSAKELFMRAKLFQFHENVRPPYWGTWRKRSKTVGPRKPLNQDEMFDYEVDSDEEWDEGGPGESLSGTENEQESEDDYEVDNEFFVPHGYLSAEEEKEDDEEENDPEKQKARLKLKQQEFEIERKKKTTELKPRILGCFFENPPPGTTLDSGLRMILAGYSAELLSDTPILTRFTVKKVVAESVPHSNSSSPCAKGPAGGNAVKSVSEEAMPHLIRFVHGNPNNVKAIAVEFQTFWSQHSQSPKSESTPSGTPKEAATVSKDASDPASEVIAPDSKLISKRQLVFTIKKIATYGKCPTNPAIKKGGAWWVLDEVRQKYGVTDLPTELSSTKEEKETSPVSTPKHGPSIKEFLVS